MMGVWGCVWGKGHSRVGKVEEKGKRCKKKKDLLGLRVPKTSVVSGKIQVSFIKF